ncbi:MULTISPECIES: hypothetical protein [Haloferacaceae]|uniref:Small CPxCG-related zinc finger protein n=1 Tax=Halorubrum laminariae TaxID=1433523 RepID=A0ABD6C043_9EURY|nr:hypothetical protein [Halorubrum laminariae]
MARSESDDGGEQRDDGQCCDNPNVGKLPKARFPTGDGDRAVYHECANCGATWG